MTRNKKILMAAGVSAGVVIAGTLARRPPRFGGIKLKRSIIIDRPAKDLYAFWQDLENLPRIGEILESVEDLGGNRSRWTIRARGGIRLHWDSEITIDRLNEMI